MFQIRVLLVKMQIPQGSDLLPIANPPVIMEKSSVRWDSSHSFTLQKLFTCIEALNTRCPVLELFMQFPPVDTRSHENYTEMVSGWGSEWTLTFYLLSQSRVGTWASVYFYRYSECRVCVKRQINETKKKPFTGNFQLQGRKFFWKAGSSYELFRQAMLQGKFILVLF